MTTSRHRLLAVSPAKDAREAAGVASAAGLLAAPAMVNQHFTYLLLPLLGVTPAAITPLRM
jgi:hypothetical protein